MLFKDSRLSLSALAFECSLCAAFQVVSEDFST